MNTKRILFWAVFIIILALIIWGLIVAMGRTSNIPGKNMGQPAVVTSLDHTKGDQNSPIVVIEYSDFQCPACRIYYYVIEELLKSSTTTFKFVYRHFPLAQHLNSIPASLASEAANVQGKFWEMHKLLFENQSDWESVNDPSSIFLSYAKEIGLNEDQYKLDIASTTLKNIIKANADEGLKIGINGTPTFFINGKAIVNPSGYDKFKTIIEQASKANIK